VRAAAVAGANPHDDADADADAHVNQPDSDADANQPDADPERHQPDPHPDPEPDLAEPGHYRSVPACQPIGLHIGKPESQRKLRDIYRYAHRAHHSGSADDAGKSLRRPAAHACERRARADRAVDRESVDTGRQRAPRHDQPGGRPGQPEA